MPPMSTIVVRSLVLWCSLECTPACQAGGRGFKSRQDRGRVAQSVERAPEKREVTGSTPVPTTANEQGGGTGETQSGLPDPRPCPLRAQTERVLAGADGQSWQ